ncbi:MAG: DNA polymerase III subunit alpha [Chitinophagaceae bacterium]|nr:DNA polymerase III subunit alpha [Chitinophagaceae bacterium]
MPDFCHLHSHTQYSLLDGAADISSLMDKAVKEEMKAIAITDHGNMFGVFQFVKEAHKKNILPIVGCEFYIVPDRFKKELIAGFGNDEDGTRGKKSFHQVLLAKNETGYKNLMKLCSLGFIDGYYYNPRIDFELIKQHSEGVIATSCCLAGIIPQHILYKSEAEAEAILKEWLDVFGEDYYIELQRHGIPEQDKVNQVLIRFARKYNVKVIATNDSHYVNQEDSEAQDILLCLQTNKAFDDPGRMRFSNNQFFFKTKAQMEERFIDIPEALDNTMEVVSKIEPLDLKKKILLPFFPLPAGYTSNQQYLEHLTWQGAKVRYDDISVAVRERLQYELSIIEKTGFSGYFLIVQDFINEAKKLGVWVGPGRGSAAGSAVAYCIGITNVDPLQYNLLFERFLNPERVSMPDMDIDFDDAGRQRVIDYVVQKYGQNQVAQIITFGTMGPKTGIRDVARVLGLPLAESNRIAKLIPEMPGMSFKRAYSEVKELAALRNSPDALIKKTIRIAETLEGCTRHHGIHAAGVIIAPSDIRDHIPVISPKDSTLLVTQYEGKLIEDAGLLKMDFLGLKTLSILKDALADIEKNHSIQIDLDKIPYDDLKTYELFQRGDTVGIFQFESPGMRKYLRELKPTHIEDLIAMNALYRPGPMNYIPDYIDRKHGRKKVSYPHPLLEEVLKPTNGIMVYQEQIMQAAQIMAGYTLGAADLLRRAMGKKDMKEMQKQRAIFVEGAKKKGIEGKSAEEVFTIMEKFAEYGFNRSHSAGYAIIAYQTAYLKANYPPEFMAATLSNYMGSTEDTQYYLNETKRFHIPTLGPDINESELKFTANKKGEIRFSLSAIKGVGEAAVIAIVAERENKGAYKNLFDLTKRVSSRSLNKKAAESLAAAGAFDCFEGTHRAQYFATLPGETISAIEKTIKNATADQARANVKMQTLFGEVAHEEMRNPVLPQTEQWPALVKLKREKEVTGVYLSGHPLEDYKMEMNNFCTSTVADLENYKNQEAAIAGIITTVEHRVSKNGKPFATFSIEDFTGATELVLFGEEYLKLKHFLVEGTMLFVKGKYQLRYNSEDRYELKISSIQLLQDIRERLTKRVTLNISLNDVNDQLILKIEELFTKYKGNFPVAIQVNDKSDNFSLNFNAQKATVNLSEEFMHMVDEFPEVELKLN